MENGSNGGSNLDRSDSIGLRRSDFISKLPDSLLFDILSFLPFSDVVSTSILSKRWRGLCRYSPTLNICLGGSERVDHFMDLKSMRRFISSVNYTLILHQSPKIDKFNVSFIYVSLCSYDIDAWLLFALRKNVQELKLYFEDACNSLYNDILNEGDENGFGDWYALPSFLFNSSSLVTLKISKCRFEEGCKPVIKWKLLKVLSIKHVSLSNSLIQNFFSSCPFLETLEVSHCEDFNHIESNSLQNLVINNYNNMPCDDEIEDKIIILAPYLRYLEISEELGAHRLSLTNSTKFLVNANISFYLNCDKNYSKQSRQMITSNLQGLLEKFCHVKYLTVGSWCLQVLSAVEEKALLLPFSNVVCLKLLTRLIPQDRFGIQRLLLLMPLLDTLVTDINAAGSVSEKKFPKSKNENGGSWESQKFSLGGTLQNLKTIKVVDFSAREDEMEFIAFMLGCAKHLQKVIIQRRKLCAASHPCNATHIAERVSSFTRCSADAIILFCEVPPKT